MDLLTRNDLKNLLEAHLSPCVSIFMPAHRGGAEEDPIRWRTHLAEAEARLAKAGWRAPAIKDLLAPGRRLLEDAPFWKNQCDGLAAFLAPEFVRVFRLPVTFKDRLVVANQFSILPLLPLFSGNGRFFVLALSQKAVRLLQGTRYSVNEVDLRGVPQNLAEALLTHEAMQPFSFYGRRAGEGAGSWGGIFHGHGVGIDDSKEELLHYFQKIDRGLHPVLREEKAPLVLAAVDYLQPIYRRANTYAHLLETGIEGNTDRLTNRELHATAWPLLRRIMHVLARPFAGWGRTMSAFPCVCALSLRAGNVSDAEAVTAVRASGSQKKVLTVPLRERNQSQGLIRMCESVQRAWRCGVRVWVFSNIIGRGCRSFPMVGV